MIQYQILKTNITRTVLQTVRRITNEILGVKGLRDRMTPTWIPNSVAFENQPLGAKISSPSHTHVPYSPFPDHDLLSNSPY